MTVQFEVHATSSRPLASVRAYIDSQDEGIPAPRNGNPFVNVSFSRSQEVASRTFQFAWNTVTDTPYNGAYRLRVVARAYSSFAGAETHAQEATRRDLLVDNPPAAIAAPRIIKATSQAVALEWDPAAEPDVQSYTVYRARTDSGEAAPPYTAFTEITTLQATNLNDAVDGKGYYWYTVIVTRRSVVTPESGISSGPSPISSAAEVKAASKPDGDGKAPGGGGAGEPKATPAPIRPRVISRLPSLTLPRSPTRTPPPVPDAPFSAVLPYDVPEGGEEIPEPSEPGGDPRGPVLPVAVGAFLVSSALALGRMPY